MAEDRSAAVSMRQCGTAFFTDFPVYFCAMSNSENVLHSSVGAEWSNWVHAYLSTPANVSHTECLSLNRIPLPLELYFHFDPDLSHRFIVRALVLFLLRLGEVIVLSTLWAFRSQEIRHHSSHACNLLAREM